MLARHLSSPCLFRWAHNSLCVSTYGKSKVVARLNTALADAPTLELVQSDGTPFVDDDGKWKLYLAEGGKALRFGPLVGTRILLK